MTRNVVDVQGDAEHPHTTPNLLPVSVVVTYFKAAVFLDALQKTLVGQNAAEVIVVVDGGGDYETVRSALSAVERLQVITTDKARGSAGARNAGAALSTQPWIAFLDDDDQWPEGFLAELFAHAHKNVVAYDNELLEQTPSGQIVPLGMTIFERQNFTKKPLTAQTAQQLLSGYPILKLLLRREAFEKIGGYRRKLFAVQDFDLVWRLVAAGNVIDLVDKPIGRYLVRPGGTTGRIASGEFRISLASQRTWMNIWARMAFEPSFSFTVRLGAAKNCARAGRRFASVLVKHVLVKKAPNGSVLKGQR